MADQGRIPTDPDRPLQIGAAEVIGYLWRVGVSARAREERAERAYHRLLRGDWSAVAELRACWREAEIQGRLALDLARSLAPPLRRRAQATEDPPTPTPPPRRPAPIPGWESPPAALLQQLPAPAPEPEPITLPPEPTPLPAPRLTWPERLRVAWLVLRYGTGRPRGKNRAS